MTAKDQTVHSADLLGRLRARLAAPAAAPVGPTSDYDMSPGLERPAAALSLRPAAVLVPVIRRAEPMVLFTRRSDHLPSHAGQVSFPGGRAQPEDPDMVATALRETHEEVGLPPRAVEVIGAIDRYETGTGFSITPVVGLIEAGWPTTACEREVAEIFEVPLSVLMDPRNHKRESAVWRGERRHYYVIPHGRHHIWGATAGMLVNLYHRLYG